MTRLQSLKTLSYSLLIVFMSLTMTGCNQTFKHQPLVDFNSLQVPTSPNYCLACPHCSGKRMIQTSTYKLSAKHLKQYWAQLISQQPRTHILIDDNEQQRYIQRTAVWHFPDIIDVRFEPIDAQHSKLYVFSRSVYGYYDFGKNCQRVRNWLNILQKLVNR